MPRQARQASGTGIYHVMMRGINHQNIFEEQEDYYQFLNTLDMMALSYEPDGTPFGRNYILYAYCLMSNHIHLLIREREDTIGMAIKRIASSYVYYYNLSFGSKILLDDLTEKAKASPRLRCNLDLRNSAEDLSQRMLNALEPGTEMPIHRHKGSSETCICVRGHFEEYFYDDQGNLTDIIDMVPGGVVLNIEKGQWHSLKCLESGTCCLRRRMEHMGNESLTPTFSCSTSARLQGKKGEGEKSTKKDMSIKDWFKGSCSKAGALNRSWTIEADRSTYRLGNSWE